MTICGTEKGLYEKVEMIKQVSKARIWTRNRRRADAGFVEKQCKEEAGERYCYDDIVSGKQGEAWEFR